MSSTASDCFFLDACILLPQQNRRFAESCANFIKEENPKCFVSSSVKETILALLKDAYEWIVGDIQGSLFPYLKKANVTNITRRSGLMFEKFFDEEREKLRMQGSPYVYYEIIGQIENWIASQIREIPPVSYVKPEDFLSVITFELSDILEKLKSPIEAIEGKQISPSTEVRAQVGLHTAPRRARTEDIIHLASAIEYQFSNDVWVVFVTFDEDHILSQKEPLWEVCCLRCSKPSYASEHLRTLSRADKPVQYYLNIKNPTLQQVAFAKAIETALKVKITP